MILHPLRQFSVYFNVCASNSSNTYWTCSVMDLYTS